MMRDTIPVGEHIEREDWRAQLEVQASSCMISLRAHPVCLFFSPAQSHDCPFSPFS